MRRNRRGLLYLWGNRRGQLPFLRRNGRARSAVSIWQSRVPPQRLAALHGSALRVGEIACQEPLTHTADLRVTDHRLAANGLAPGLNPSAVVISVVEVRPRDGDGYRGSHLVRWRLRLGSHGIEPLVAEGGHTTSLHTEVPKSRQN